MTWLDPSELRIGLGCMRLTEELGPATIAAAADAGITVFDTARAYPGSERMLAAALRGRRARIVTKGGMRRDWVPDGRAKAIRADCEASLAALDGLPIDLYLVHAPDPRTPWATTVRALARLLDDGFVNRIGVSNVNRRQLDEALELAPVAAVQVALSIHDERALRGGVLDRCEEAGIALIAHSPLGGPRRARRSSTPAEVELARLLDLSPAIVAIPGATRPETARSAAHAAALALEPADRPRRASRRRARGGGDVVLVMGIPGAGKSRVAEEYVARGYHRLNRDERGGSLRELAEELDTELSSGVRRIVLDNTYLTRASRSYVLDAAARHGAAARCVWLATTLAQAQVNLVERLLERVGSLPSPDELRTLARREPGVLTPTSQMRNQRELEPPSLDEGWADVEQVPFTRAPRGGRAAVFVAAAATEHGDPTAPHLVFDWNPDGLRELLDAAVARLRAEVVAPVEGALCPHPGGPPSCWCRPPLPGLPLAFARAHDVDPARSVLVGTGAAHRSLAAALGARFVQSRGEHPPLPDRSKR